MKALKDAQKSKKQDFLVGVMVGSDSGYMWRTTLDSVTAMDAKEALDIWRKNRRNSQYTEKAHIVEADEGPPSSYDKKQRDRLVNYTYEAAYKGKKPLKTNIPVLGRLPNTMGLA